MLKKNYYYFNPFHGTIFAQITTLLGLFMFKKTILLLFALALFQIIYAQDTLPNFSVIKMKDGLSNIKWINNYGIVKQITIQRSTDSLKRFASVVTIENAMSKKVLFIDKKSKGTNFYYRLFVQLPEGQFFYTKSQRFYFDKIKMDSARGEIDSVKNNTNTGVVSNVFVPSDYLFTDNKNNVILLLPNAETKKYRIVFYDENNKLVLTIPKVKESNLILEKYNFSHSGWYYYEIYEGDKLFEKHKFNITKDKP